MNAVVDQGQCGSCWAFANVALMESVHKLTNPTTDLLKLSEQQMIDCNPWGNGCQGAYPDQHFSGWMIPSPTFYAIERTAYAAGGPEYIAARNSSCNPNNAETTAVKPLAIAGHYAQNAPIQYINALNTKGPLEMWIRADTSIFQGYRSGIINSSCCLGGSLTLNHVVQLVGWKIEAGKSYWIVRNSWGTSWGQQGYVYIKMTT